MFESLEALDHVRLNFSQGSLVFLNISLAIIMFGVALGINVSDFKTVIYKPKATIIGYVSQFFLLPALTFLLILVIRPTPSVALGMIMVAACPGGNISNFLSSLAKGNTALSVTMTALATLSAIFMTPFNFSFWGGLYVNYYNNQGGQFLRPLEIEPFQMFITVFIILGIPVILGVLFSQYFPKITKKIIKPIKNFSIVFFLIMVFVMLKNNLAQFINHIHVIFIIVLIHNALALGTGFSISSLFKLKRRDRRSISIETGIQNSGLALTLMFNPKIFPVDFELGGMAVIAAWWGIWHILSGLIMATFWGRKPILDES
ncbi:MAG: bile acid:sodium symporter family protein [Prolixibacteraceae bacterium]|jgi:BASS family bile acid:Na+ symporter|nr:bile acid:sodium symporter family protein [Prolixibacteraceae bacterium]